MNLRYAEYVQFGLQLGLTMALPVLLGVWLDSRYGTGPWFMLAGVFLGFISMMWTIVKTAMELNRRDRNRKAERSGKENKES
jgi:F0F1-type ATP synthase assembly protein I